MLQNFCFKFKFIENCDFLVVEWVASFSLAILGDDEIFLMLHAVLATVFGNFKLVIVLLLLLLGVVALDWDAIDDFVLLFDIVVLLFVTCDKFEFRSLLMVAAVVKPLLLFLLANVLNTHDAVDNVNLFIRPLFAILLLLFS